MAVQDISGTQEDVIKVFSIEGECAAALEAACRDLPDVELDDRGYLCAMCLTAYRRVLPQIEELATIAAGVSADLASRDVGYAVVDFSEAVSGLAFDAMTRVISAFSSLVATPVRVFDRWGLWKELGVSFDVAPQRATGTGYNPFHIDVVNAVTPPDYSLLYCHRPDPLDGGFSLVSNMQQAADALGGDDVEALSRPVFREGSFYALSGVGDELNPFAVLAENGSGLRRIRFTAKMIPDLPESPEKSALMAFERLLVERQHCFLLRKHQLLLMNQRTVAHARLPLTQGQEVVPLHERRLILQSFMTPAQ